MIEIIAKLQNPIFWFQGLFFPTLIIVVAAVAKKVPSRLKSYTRWLKLRDIKKIMKIRRNDYEIQYLISYERSYFIAFIGILALYIILLILTPLATLTRDNIGLFLFSSIPIYILEIHWLNQKTLVKRLIISAGKLKSSRNRAI